MNFSPFGAKLGNLDFFMDFGFHYIKTYLYFLSRWYNSARIGCAIQKVWISAQSIQNWGIWLFHGFSISLHYKSTFDFHHNDLKMQGQAADSQKSLKFWISAQSKQFKYSKSVFTQKLAFFFANLEIWRHGCSQMGLSCLHAKFHKNRSINAKTHDKPG